MADAIMASVKTQLGEYMEMFTANVETMHNTVEHVTAAVKDITSKMHDFKDGFANKIDEITDGFQETAGQLVQATHELTEKTIGTNNKVMDILAAPSLTYAVAVHQHTHPDCTALIAKGHTADRQILIQKDCDATDNALESLTEKDLVTKANTMLDLMGWEGLNKPQNTKFLGVKKLCGGSILYQMNSADVAMWL
jgi:PBP1b-binding outer membrane lipoprotein LpoB